MPPKVAMKVVKATAARKPVMKNKGWSVLPKKAKDIAMAPKKAMKRPAAAAAAQKKKKTGKQPDTKLLFENDRLRITSCTLPAGAVIEVAHALPTARWRLLADELPTPEPCFFRAGETARIDNSKGSEGLQEIVFEILQDPRRTQEQGRLSIHKKYDAEPATALMLENEYCKLWDFRMPPRGGNRLDFHQHMLTYAFVWLRRGKLNCYMPDGKGGAEYCGDLENHELGVNWNDVLNGGYEADGAPKAPKAVHAVENGLDTPFREYMIELK